MDDMKAKYYKALYEKYKNTRQFIFILDWDEVISDGLASEINKLDMNNDVYLINRHTYLISRAMDSASYLPLLFESKSVEINTFAKFHDLYRIRSKKIKKIS
jgi:hypothetical protein